MEANILPKNSLLSVRRLGLRGRFYFHAILGRME